MTVVAFVGFVVVVSVVGVALSCVAVVPLAVHQQSPAFVCAVVCVGVVSVGVVLRVS